MKEEEDPYGGSTDEGSDMDTEEAPGILQKPAV